MDAQRSKKHGMVAIFSAASSIFFVMFMSATVVSGKTITIGILEESDIRQNLELSVITIHNDKGRRYGCTTIKKTWNGSYLFSCIIYFFRNVHVCNGCLWKDHNDRHS